MMTDHGPRDRLDYGAALRRLRHERGLGLNDTAARAGVSPAYLSEVERGYKWPSTDVLAKLAGAFGMAPSELLAYIEASGVMRGRVASMMAEPRRYLMRAAVPAPSAEDVAFDAADMGGLTAPRERSLQALMRMARAMSDDDLRLLLELARRLLERR